MARFSTLDAWLGWQESLHPSTIDLGLERVAQVWQQLQPKPAPFPIITVAGTNGKGSSLAMLEAILQAAGYRTGAYSSPHLLRYNERVRLSGQPVDDAALCAAFERIDRARGAVSLTYFEFGTLAALDIFWRSDVDAVILEVGLGGRLDAVNILDADVALVTTVALDHTQWLGDDVETVAREKAGIYRAHRPAIYGSPHAPVSLRAQAAALDATLLCYGEDFSAAAQGDRWRWWGRVGGCEWTYANLPLPALRGRVQLQNAAAVLMALACLSDRLTVSEPALHEGLRAVCLPGRFQRLPGAVPIILDVAHNPQAAAELAANLAAEPCAGRTLAVVGMLEDKDQGDSLKALLGEVDLWYPASLAEARGASAEGLAVVLRKLKVAPEQIQLSNDPSIAIERALAQADSIDRIVVFGSFYTVAGALSRLQGRHGLVPAASC